MKALLVGLVVVANSFLLLIPATASATDVLPGKNICRSASKNGGQEPAVCADKASAGKEKHPITKLISEITKVIAIVAGVIAVIMIIISGLRFVLSGGDSQKVAGARNNLLYAIIGVAIIALASTIISFVVGAL